MIKNLMYEYRVYRTLKKLSKQRVGLVLQPGNVWVIEYAISDDEKTDAILKTCYMRGWVEPLQNSVPIGKLKEDFSLPNPNELSNQPMWKLTDSGWGAINRTYQIALLGLFLTVLGLYVTSI